VTGGYGLNVAGYLRGELGIGEAARLLLLGVEAAEIPFRAITYRAGLGHRQDHPFVADERNELHDISVICLNPPELRLFAVDVGPEFFEGRHSIGFWWWELATFPRTLHSGFALLDEIWVGSEFTRQAIANETDLPVLRFPMPVRRPEPARRSRADLGLSPGFLFLFAFDFASTVERKNPHGIIEAFVRAFAPGEGPSLVLKSINGDTQPAKLDALRRAASGRSDVRIIDRYMSADDRDALMATCDCYVSLHRSEGFGLTIAEAMALGKPAIATAYSGNLTFMNEQNSYLVPHTWTRVPGDAAPYPVGAEWAEPDLDAAAKAMRHVYENPEEARLVGEEARRHILERHSPGIAADFLETRLGEIASREPLSTSALWRDLAQAHVAITRLEARLKGQKPVSTDGIHRRVHGLRGLLLSALDRALGSELRESLGEILLAQQAIAKRLDRLDARLRTHQQRDSEL
jgi:glycosyltransferase involved in cell wall biosynthesis